MKVNVTKGGLTKEWLIGEEQKQNQKMESIIEILDRMEKKLDGIIEALEIEKQNPDQGNVKGYEIGPE